MAKVYFSTGSNQGDRLKSLLVAAKLINSQIGEVIGFSSIVESEPWGFKAETNFYNQVLLVETGLSPQTILEAILLIEKQMGRIRTGNAYSSRIIDIDILFYDNLVIESPTLVIPHPRLNDRNFVLKPLNEIAPQLLHPVLKKTIAELFTLSSDPGSVKTVVEKAEFGKLMDTKNIL